ncbi:MAG: hypothetical protein RL330_1266 [Actinomycetota bacterium]
MTVDYTALLGAWCTAMSLGFVWPQVVRTMRHDTTQGISAFSTLHAIVGSSLWFTYGIHDDTTAVWFSNASFILAQVLIATVLRRHGRLTLQMTAGFSLALAVILVVILPVDPAMAGTAAIVASATSLVPQVIHVMRSPNLHGISLLSWGTSLVSAMSWTLFGWVVGNQTYAALNYFSMPMIAYVITKAAAWRRRNGVPVFTLRHHPDPDLFLADLT